VPNRLDSKFVLDLLLPKCKSDVKESWETETAKPQIFTVKVINLQSRQFFIFGEIYNVSTVVIYEWIRLRMKFAISPSYKEILE